MPKRVYFTILCILTEFCVQKSNADNFQYPNGLKTPDPTYGRRQHQPIQSTIYAPTPTEYFLDAQKTQYDKTQTQTKNSKHSTGPPEQGEIYIYQQELNEAIQGSISYELENAGQEQQTFANNQSHLHSGSPCSKNISQEPNQLSVQDQANDLPLASLANFQEADGQLSNVTQEQLLLTSPLPLDDNYQYSSERSTQNQTKELRQISNENTARDETSTVEEGQMTSDYHSQLKYGPKSLINSSNYLQEEINKEQPAILDTLQESTDNLYTDGQMQERLNDFFLPLPYQAKNYNHPQWPQPKDQTNSNRGSVEKIHHEPTTFIPNVEEVPQTMDYIHAPLYSGTKSQTEDFEYRIKVQEPFKSIQKGGAETGHESQGYILNIGQMPITIDDFKLPLLSRPKLETTSNKEQPPLLFGPPSLVHGSNYLRKLQTPKTTTEVDETDKEIFYDATNGVQKAFKETTHEPTSNKEQVPLLSGVPSQVQGSNYLRKLQPPKTTTEVDESEEETYYDAAGYGPSIAKVKHTIDDFQAPLDAGPQSQIKDFNHMRNIQTADETHDAKDTKHETTGTVGQKHQTIDDFDVHYSGPQLNFKDSTYIMKIQPSEQAKGVRETIEETSYKPTGTVSTIEQTIDDSQAPLYSGPQSQIKDSNYTIKMQPSDQTHEVEDVEKETHYERKSFVGEVQQTKDNLQASNSIGPQFEVEDSIYIMKIQPPEQPNGVQETSKEISYEPTDSVSNIGQVHTTVDDSQAPLDSEPQLQIKDSNCIMKLQPPKQPNGAQKTVKASNHESTGRMPNKGQVAETIDDYQAPLDSGTQLQIKDSNYVLQPEWTNETYLKPTGHMATIGQVQKSIYKSPLISGPPTHNKDSINFMQIQLTEEKKEVLEADEETHHGAKGYLANIGEPPQNIDDFQAPQHAGQQNQIKDAIYTVKTQPTEPANGVEETEEETFHEPTGCVLDIKEKQEAKYVFNTPIYSGPHVETKDAIYLRKPQPIEQTDGVEETAEETYHEPTGCVPNRGPHDHAVNNRQASQVLPGFEAEKNNSKDSLGTPSHETANRLHEQEQEPLPRYELEYQSNSIKSPSRLTGRTDELKTQRLESARNLNNFCTHKVPGMHAHPYDCTKFITCDYGRMFETICPSGTHFDGTLLMCDHKYKVRCANEVFKEATQSRGILCPKGANGHFPYPFSRRQYIVCSNSQTLVKTCPAGKYFSVTRLFCESMPNGWTDELRKDTYRVFTCPTASGEYLYPFNPSRYIKCLPSQILQIISCPIDQLYSITRRMCLAKTEVSPFDRVRSLHEIQPLDSPTAAVLYGQIYQIQCPLAVFGVFPHPFKNTDYIKCFDGHLVIKSCRRGLLFSLSQKICEQSEHLGLHDTSVPRELSDVKQTVNGENNEPMNSTVLKCPVGVTDKFIYPFLNTRYIQCLKGVLVVATCSNDEVYAIRAKRCVPRIQVDERYYVRGVEAAFKTVLNDHNLDVGCGPHDNNRHAQP